MLHEFIFRYKVRVEDHLADCRQQGIIKKTSQEAFLHHVKGETADAAEPYLFYLMVRVL